MKLLAIISCILAMGCTDNIKHRAPQAKTPPARVVSKSLKGKRSNGKRVTSPKKLNAVRKKRTYVVRTTAQIRKTGNFLKHEKSLYLLQHKHNPMEWYGWGKPALQRAKDENKPIFLSIGYSACHWCHVMEKNVFEKDDVAQFMNKHFVSIKVDREERPDLDTIYMDAIHAMRGRGGWPMSVFLTPDLKPFFGATYIPHGRFMRLIKSLKETYATNPQQLIDKGNKIQRRLQKLIQPAQGLSIDPSIMSNAVSYANRRFDSEWGGFRQRIKFPVPPKWQFLMHRFRKTANPMIAKIVKFTLDKMASGGIFDHIGGGFHRYSTDRKWRVPHFEKMMYDNGQLANLYLEASVVFNNSKYLAVAKSTLQWIIDEMTQKGGGFYSSLDADSEGHEGRFYMFRVPEIVKLVGATDGPPLAALLSVSARGDIDGRSCITRNTKISTVAETYKRPEAEIAKLFNKYRRTLHVYRNKREWPGLDKKVIAGWNGLALSAFAKAYRIIGDAKYRRAATQTADFLWKAHHRGNGRIYRVSYSGKGAVEGLLVDYAFLAHGYIELFVATQEARHLRRAIALANYVRKHFARNAGGWFVTPTFLKTPMRRSFTPWDSVIPSGNSIMLQVLLKLSALTGNDAYRQDVEIALRAYIGLLRRAGLSTSTWLDAMQNFLGPFYEVIIAGDPNDATTKRLVEVYRRLHPSYAVLVRVSASGATTAQKKLMPVVTGKTANNGKARAYVCKFQSCKRPTSDPAVFLKQLRSGWKK